MTIRVPGEGDAPMTKKGSKGDLLVRVNVGPSDVFRRQGTHLYHDAAIPLQTAVLGGRVRVPTLDGDVEVRVSPGTQPGEDVVLRGRGVDSISRKGSKGDLFISFSVEIPRSADPPCSFHFLPQLLSSPFLISLHSTWRRNRKK
jgi:molecular chaperone DnaJ